MVLRAAAGGFMYLGLSEVTFDIADGKTLVIGNTRTMARLTLLLERESSQNRFRRVWYLMQITMTLLVRCRLKTVKLPWAAADS